MKQSPKPGIVYFHYSFIDGLFILIDIQLAKGIVISTKQIFYKDNKCWFPYKIVTYHFLWVLSKYQAS